MDNKPWLLIACVSWPSVDARAGQVVTRVVAKWDACVHSTESFRHALDNNSHISQFIILASVINSKTYKGESKPWVMWLLRN